MQAPVQRFEQVKTVHANKTLTATECLQALFGEPALADEKAAGPYGFVLGLGIEGPEISGIRLSILPAGFKQVRLVRKDQAAVDLLANQAKRSPRCHAVGVE